MDVKKIPHVFLSLLIQDDFAQWVDVRELLFEKKKHPPWPKNVLIEKLKITKNTHVTPLLAYCIFLANSTNFRRLTYSR